MPIYYVCVNVRRKHK